MENYRIGLGFDVHRFDKRKRGFMLGGVNVSAHFGLRAISDGDVVLHSISDALCGASCLGDIGDYFSKKNSKGLNSKKIISYIIGKMGKKYKIVNVDVTIVSERPPLLKYKKKISNSLKKILNCRNVNTKIKSKERLDILGAKNALSCIVVVMLKLC